MQLSRLRLRNFRCFRDEIAIDFDDITALVGKNDAGKSSVMEALEIFLNDAVPDKDDASKHGDSKDLTIICEFQNIPSEVIIDDANPTDLQSEHLLNEEGRLEIHKTYSGHLKTPKLESVKAFCMHPTRDTLQDLILLKNTDLKKKANELGVDLAGIDPKRNASIRECIRTHVGDLACAPSFVPLDQDNAKNVWSSLKAYLPSFALFKSDRESTDQDAEAQDPLKAAVKEAIKAKEEELARISQFVEAEVTKIANATLEKLHEMDPSLASKLNPQFAPPKWDGLFRASITGDENIPINKRGSGVKRLILLSFFRAKAEQQAKDAGREGVIYAIEEPETSQHPNNQRMLLRALVELSTESQVVLSTHTPMLARCLPDRDLRYINVKQNGTREILRGGKKTNQLFAEALGVLPDNTVQLFIGVEGKHDITFLQTISKALLEDGMDVMNLEKLEIDGRVIFFPLGGSTLALWTCRLEKLNRPEFHLYDRDEPPPNAPKHQAQIDEVNGRIGCKARSTSKKEMENYLHKTAIEKAYGEHNVEITLDSDFDDFDDVPAEMAKAVHEASESTAPWAELTDENKARKESQAKRILNAIAPKYMTNKLLSEVDPDGDLLEWFNDMKDLMAG